MNAPNASRRRIYFFANGIYADQISGGDIHFFQTAQAAMDAGLIEPQAVRPLAHLLLGAIDEGAMLVARADDGGLTRAQVGAAVEGFLDKLAPGASSSRDTSTGKA